MVRASIHPEQYIYHTELIDGVKFAAPDDWSSIAIESDSKKVGNINRNVTDWSELGVIYEGILKVIGVTKDYEILEGGNK